MNVAVKQGDRASVRWPSDQLVTIMQGDTLVRGQAINLSEHGVRVRMERPLASNQTARLSFEDGLLVDALPVWGKGSEFGLKFVALPVASEDQLSRVYFMTQSKLQQNNPLTVAYDLAAMDEGYSTIEGIWRALAGASYHCAASILAGLFKRSSGSHAI